MWFDYATSAKMDPAVLPEFVRLKKFTQSWQNSCCMFVGLWELKSMVPHDKRDAVVFMMPRNVSV